jgi:hypothetical protein
MVAFRSEGDWVVRARMVAGAQEGAARNRPAREAQHVRHWRPVPFYEFLIAVTIAAGISLATFAHADRNGNSHATAWGVGAFLAAGVVVPIYIVQVWLRRRRPSG